MANIVVVPVLQDNYAYLIIDQSSGKAAVVDPVEPNKLIQAARNANVDIVAALCTHSHWDHAGGNSELRTLFPGIPIYGGKADGVEAVTKEVWQGDTVRVGDLVLEVLATPCHTAGHVCYVVPAASGEPPSVFTGDTLFVAGAGNFNAGTPQQMYTALYDRIGILPPETRVYVGHEYTVKNLEFALTVEPGNPDVQQRMAWAKARRQEDQPTVPSTLADEFKTNPFMRVNEVVVKSYTGKDDPVCCLLELRLRKNEWGRRGK